MRFDRRTFIKGTAAGVGASALLPGTGGAKPPSATLDDRLDADGGPQEVIVVFRTNEDATVLDQYDLSEGYYRFEVLPMAYTVATGAQIESLARRQSVRRVAPNYELDYYNGDASRETGAQAIVEELGYDGSNAHVAVIDSGIDGPHPDHQANLVHNYQPVSPLEVGNDQVFVDAGRADTDDSGHGTHVSGSVAGDGSQRTEYRGMAPGADLTVYSLGATIFVLNSLLAYDHLVARQEAGETNVQAVNNSFGSDSGANFDPDAPGNVATYRAYRAGILPVIAAGNCGPSCDITCGSCGDNTLNNAAQAPWVLGVAATDDEKNVTDFSSRGRPPDYGGLVNYDRSTALANYEEYRRQFRPPGEDASTEQVTGIQGSGVLANFLLQTADTFTLAPAPETGLAEVDGYFATATLTWSPATGEGNPEPSEWELRLVDPDGNEVATAGSTFVDRTRERAAVTLHRWLPLPDSSATYEVEVVCSRGGGEYEVAGEVVAVDAADGLPDPSRPYGLERPSVGAPGNAVWSTMLPGDQFDGPADGEPYYAAISGTSMASPVTAGVVALLNDGYVEEVGEFPEPLAVIEALESTAEFLPDRKNHTVHNVGRGFVDAEAALQALLAPDDEAAGAPPTIDRFEPAERAKGSDRNTRYHVDWAVSDDDADLATVTTELVDESGTSRASETSDVGGETAAGTHRVATREDVSELRLTVADASGNTSTAAESI